MASGTDRICVDGFGGDSPVQDPVSWNSRGSDFTIWTQRSSGRSRLTSPKVMSIANNRCIRVLIPDENVTWLSPTLRMLRLVT